MMQAAARHAVPAGGPFASKPPAHEETEWSHLKCASFPALSKPWCRRGGKAKEEPAAKHARPSQRVVRMQLASGHDAIGSRTASPSPPAPAQNAIRFRPCIDIHQGKVKQIVGSTLRDLSPGNDADPGGVSSDSQALVTNFESAISSAEYAEMYRSDRLSGGHVIMLGADPASQEAAMAAIQAYPGGLQVGGGINPENATGYLDAGASHVIVTSYVFRDGRVDEERLQQLVRVVGRQRLVLDLSCRKKDGEYRVVTDRWQRFSDVALSQQSLDELAASADEFLVHGVDVEGMRLGIDDELVELLGRWSPIPVTYAGGARTLEDLERVRVAGSGAVDITVGSALDIFGGDLPYRDVVAWHWQQQQQQQQQAATT